MIKKSRADKRYLFWCCAYDGNEAWFEVANNRKQARLNYCSIFGHEIEDIKSKLVCEIPRKSAIESGQNVTIEYLKQIGFEIIAESYPHIVRFNGQVFKSGSFFEKMLEDGDIPKFSCVYFFKILETDRFKIGSTTNLIARKMRLESQQAFHIHLKTFIETDDIERVERFIIKFLEKFKVKGDEWFRMDNFITAVSEVLFEIIKMEIRVTMTFDYKSEIFEIMTNILKDILLEHKFGTEPTEELIQKLNIVYTINAKRKGKLTHKIQPDEIIKLWVDNKEKNNELELMYLKEFCPYKLGDKITDEYQNKYKVEGREVYFSEKDKTARFYYSGTQLLKNGKEGKRFHNFISAKDTD